MAYLGGKALGRQAVGGKRLWEFGRVEWGLVGGTGKVHHALPLTVELTLHITQG